MNLGKDTVHGNSKQAYEYGNLTELRRLRYSIHPHWPNSPLLTRQGGCPVSVASASGPEYFDSKSGSRKGAVQSMGADVAEVLGISNNREFNRKTLVVGQ